MLNRRRISNESKSLFRVASRLVCLLVLVVAAYSLAIAQSGTRISCLIDNGDGTATLVSCGSSAGNFIALCHGTGPCDVLDDPSTLWLANQVCADYQQNGCPTNDGGGGGIGGLMP